MHSLSRALLVSLSLVAPSLQGCTPTAAASQPSAATPPKLSDLPAADAGPREQGGSSAGSSGEALLAAPGEPVADPANLVSPLPGDSSCTSRLERPRRSRGADPGYTEEALAARVEGLAVARCRITAAGTAEDCRILKSLPHLDAAVLRALAESRYEPARCQGKPVEVSWVFTFRFALPQQQDRAQGAGAPGR